MPNKDQNQLNRLVDSLVLSIQKMMDNLPVAQTPFNQVKVPPLEQRVAYQQMRDDPEAWTKVLSEHGVQGAIDYWKAMEGQGNGSKASKAEPELGGQ
jgi:hypothetical protein